MKSPIANSRTSLWKYAAAGLVTAVVTFLLLALSFNIFERKTEGLRHYFPVVDLNESSFDAAEWGKNFPQQYETYQKTVDKERTRHGGSEALMPSRLDQNPHLRRFFAGYPFGVDFREARGHAFMLDDQDLSLRTQKFSQTGACLHCHSSVLPAYLSAGDGDLMKGFEAVCRMPLADARQLVEHPVSCIDCHDPQSMALRVTRPAFILGIQQLAKSADPLPQFPSLEQWREGNRAAPYDVNALASRQEMRSFVCGQCHVEYYFHGEGRLVTYPWDNGLKFDQIEAYYDQIDYTDWIHEETQAPLLKAQHPEFEMWSQGVHAQAGVSCADCHMPYYRVGSVKVSDHQPRSPMLNAGRACRICHRVPEDSILDRVETLQSRTDALQRRAEQAVIDLLDAIVASQARGVAEDALHESRSLHRRAQWRIDYCDAENSRGFHASQEFARILAEAIDYARQGQLSATIAEPSTAAAINVRQSATVPEAVLSEQHQQVHIHRQRRLPQPPSAPVLKPD